MLLNILSSSTKNPRVLSINNIQSWYWKLWSLIHIIKILTPRINTEFLLSVIPDNIEKTNFRHGIRLIFTKSNLLCEGNKLKLFFICCVKRFTTLFLCTFKQTFHNFYIKIIKICNVKNIKQLQTNFCKLRLKKFYRSFVTVTQILVVIRKSKENTLYITNLKVTNKYCILL